MRSLFRLTLALIVCGYAPLARAQYGTSVDTWIPGTNDVQSLDLVTGSPCALTGRTLDFNDALGAPDGKFVSVGQQGFIGIKLESDVVDLPGPDIAVWLSCDAASECHNFLVAITHEPSRGWGQVGTVLGESYGEFDIYFSPGDPPVRYVAVWDASCDGYGGVDVDAVVNLQAIVAVKATTWGAVKALYR